MVETSGDDLPETVIPREQAVFWMDGRGRWRNAGGPFRVRRIIARFNRAIRRDAGGYYLTQVNGQCREKIYFPHAETALFVVRLHGGGAPELELNTGRRLPLEASRLFICGDSLYFRVGAEIAKFGEQALLAMAAQLEMAGEGECHLVSGSRRVRVPVVERLPGSCRKGVDPPAAMG